MYSYLPYRLYFQPKDSLEQRLQLQPCARKSPTKQPPLRALVLLMRVLATLEELAPQQERDGA